MPLWKGYKYIKRIIKKKMTNQEIILTKVEIKELIGSLNRNPDETEIRAVIDYFWLRPYALKHLEEKEFRKSFVRLIYMHKNAMNWWVKADKEVKSLQPLTSSLEKERNELLEKIKELEAKVEEKDNIIENLEERVDMEVEMNLKALDKSKEYHDRNLFLLGMSKDTIITNLKLKIQELEKNQKVDKVKQLQKLENKAKTKVKERVKKLKEKINTIKESVKEKFNTYILQNNK